MLVESIAVLAIYVLLLVTFLRSKHLGYAVVTLPIVVLPLGYLMASGLARLTGETLFGARSSIAMLFANVLSLLVASALVVFASRKIQSKRNRTLYLLVMLLFTLLLGWVYIYHALQFIV